MCYKSHPSTDPGAFPNLQETQAGKTRTTRLLTRGHRHKPAARGMGPAHAAAGARLAGRRTANRGPQELEASRAKDARMTGHIEQKGRRGQRGERRATPGRRGHELALGQVEVQAAPGEHKSHRQNVSQSLQAKILPRSRSDHRPNASEGTLRRKLQRPDPSLGCRKGSCLTQA